MRTRQLSIDWKSFDYNDIIHWIGINFVAKNIQYSEFEGNLIQKIHWLCS